MKGSELPTQQEILDEIRSILNSLTGGDLSPSAYDTAWVARIPSKTDSAKPMFPQCLTWVIENQLPDGSWGTPNMEYYHDRVISTLSCIISLKTWQIAPDKILKGIDYINLNLRNLIRDHHDTIGFELLLPSLVSTSEKLGIRFSRSNQKVIERYRELANKKLKKIPLETLYSIKSNISHSIEFLEGYDVDLNRISICQQLANGSFGNSPAATSFIVTHTKNSKAEDYLRSLLQKFHTFVPSIYPFEIFEKAWILDSLNYASLDLPEIATIVDYLCNNWNRTYGITISETFPFYDLDDTSLVFKVLNERRITLSTDIFKYYKKEGFYVCFPFELDPSVSTYVHFLGALNTINNQYDDFLKDRALIIEFLYKNQEAEGYWFDKWHISPYYTTSHLIIELFKFNSGVSKTFDKGVNWLLSSQKSSGGWGYFERETLEETAYAIQALIYLHSNTKQKTYFDAIKKGFDYILKQSEDRSYLNDYLWIDKGLYATYSINRVLLLSLMYTYINLIKDNHL